MRLLLICLLIVGCGRKPIKSYTPNPPCYGSKLIGKWYLDTKGSYAMADDKCSYIEYSADNDAFYTGTYVDHNKGSTKGTFSILYDVDGPATIEYTIIDKQLVYRVI